MPTSGNTRTAWHSLTGEGEGGGSPGVVGGALPNRLTGRRGREGLEEEG